MQALASQRPTVSIVGAGRLGSALVRSLDRAGWPVASIVVRPNAVIAKERRKLARTMRAKLVRLAEIPRNAGLVWITVPDDAISSVAAELAEAQTSWRGVTVFHSSGALTSDALAPLRAKGARVASVHPGMTFVAKSDRSFKGVPFGIEGDPSALRLARRIIADLGGTAVTIRKENKVLYHAFDVFASPMLIALMSALEEVGLAAGIPRKKLGAMAGPLLRQTLDNYLRHGAAAAFSGPFIRGDVEVISRHLDALKRGPAAREAYLALARVVVKNLPVKNRDALQNLLHKSG